jgi:leucyl-tRNA synthetase
MKNFLLILAPFAPHIAEELWHTLGENESLAYTPWPEYDEVYTQEETITIPIQINGTLRAHLQISADASTKECEDAALADPKIQRHVEGKTIRKVIVVPKKIINIVIS